MKHIFLLALISLLGLSGCTQPQNTKPVPKAEASSPVSEEAPQQESRVKITKFFDFGCGFCRQGAQAMKQLKEKYGDEVQIELRHFVIHPPVMDIHRASECARAQGKFEDFFYSYFLDHYGESADTIVADIGLDRKSYQACMANPKSGGLIESHKKIGQLMGITGTPHFIINDKKRIGGYADFEKFDQLIQEYR